MVTINSGAANTLSNYFDEYILLARKSDNSTYSCKRHTYTHHFKNEIKLWGLCSEAAQWAMRNAVVEGSSLILTTWDSYNMHPKHSTQAFLHSSPIRTWLQRLGIEPATSCSAAQCHSHLAEYAQHFKNAQGTYGITTCIVRSHSMDYKFTTICSHMPTLASFFALSKETS